MSTGDPCVCVCCGVPGALKCRGLIAACYEKHRRNGTLRRFGSKWRSRLREKCEVPWCCIVVHCRGLCRKHYDVWRAAIQRANPWRQRRRLIEHEHLPLLRIVDMIERFDNLLLESMKHGELSRRRWLRRAVREEDA